jgi:hypothetical protein
MPILPLIFDTILGLGATGIVLLAHTRFYTSGSAPGRSPSWSLFCHFWRGESRRRAKLACVVAHRCHDVPPDKAKKNKTTGCKRHGDVKMKNGRETKFQTGDETLGGKTKFSARTGCDR